MAAAATLVERNRSDAPAFMHVHVPAPNESKNNEGLLPWNAASSSSGYLAAPAPLPPHSNTPTCYTVPQMHPSDHHCSVLSAPCLPQPAHVHPCQSAPLQGAVYPAYNWNDDDIFDDDDLAQLFPAKPEGFGHGADPHPTVTSRNRHAQPTGFTGQGSGVLETSNCTPPPRSSTLSTPLVPTAQLASTTCQHSPVGAYGPHAASVNHNCLTHRLTSCISGWCPQAAAPWQRRQQGNISQAQAHHDDEVAQQRQAAPRPH